MELIQGTDIYYSLLSFALLLVYHFTYLIFGSSHWKLFLEIGVPKKTELFMRKNFKDF